MNAITHITDRGQVVKKSAQHTMTQGRKYFEMVGRLDGYNCLPDGYDERTEWVGNYLRLRRLALKHHRLAEMECNGVGIVRGSWYYVGAIDDWAKREYGYSVKSAYIEGETTIFDVESDRVEEKIKALAAKLHLRVEFQGDPRGATVKLFRDYVIETPHPTVQTQNIPIFE